MDYLDFYIDTCLWVVGCRKPNPRMNSCMEIITNPFFFFWGLEVRLSKTLGLM